MQVPTKNFISEIVKKSARSPQLLGVGLLITVMGISACQPQNPISNNTSQSIEPSVQASVTPTPSSTNSASQKQVATPSNTASLKTVKVFFQFRVKRICN